MEISAVSRRDSTQGTPQTRRDIGQRSAGIQRVIHTALDEVMATKKTFPTGQGAGGGGSGGPPPNYPRPDDLR